MSDITEEDVMEYCYSRNLMLVTKESLEYMHRPIVIENAPTVNAIPIEWFKKEIDWHLETVTYGAEVYQWVLNRWYEDKENWEKENENR